MATTKKRAPARRRPRKAKAGTRGLTASECRLDALSGEGADAKARVEDEGAQPARQVARGDPHLPQPDGGDPRQDGEGVLLLSGGGVLRDDGPLLREEPALQRRRVQLVRTPPHRIFG